jgi:hypothetical protein
MTIIFLHKSALQTLLLWHMPAAPAMKGTEFIALAAKVLGKDLHLVLRMYSIFDPLHAFESFVALCRLE